MECCASPGASPAGGVSTIDRAELLRDPRLATSADRLVNAAACIAELDRIFAACDLADWKDALPAMTVPWTVVQTAAEAVVDPQVGANGLVSDIEGGVRRRRLVALHGTIEDQRGRPAVVVDATYLSPVVT